MIEVREAIHKKKRFPFGHCPKGGWGITSIRKFAGTFFSLFFASNTRLKEGLKFVPKFFRKCYLGHSHAVIHIHTHSHTKVPSCVSKTGRGLVGERFYANFGRSPKRSCFFLWMTSKNCTKVQDIASHM